MHPGQDGRELLGFQTRLVLRIGAQKSEAIPETVLSETFSIDSQLTERAYRLDSHALQLSNQSLFDIWPHVFLDAAAVLQDGRGGCLLLLWRWRRLPLSWLLLSETAGFC